MALAPRASVEMMELVTIQRGWRLRLRRRLLVRVSVAVAAACFSFSSTASAQTQFHEYSVAGETSAAGHLTGLNVGRYDTEISTGGSCTSGVFTAPVIYATQWVILTDDATNWLEIGTSHKNSTCRFWFWGYGSQSQWFPLGTQGNVAKQFHNFKILRGANGATWSFIIDVTTMPGTINWSTVGRRVEAGLESYVSYGVAPAHDYSKLQYNVGGVWYNWANRDGSTVGQSMCGRWLTDVSWIAGQNATC